jgi:hypothetical protein
LQLLDQSIVESEINEGHRPCIASCGIPLVFAELTSRAVRPEADLVLARTIGQGFDMGRPSLLEASAVRQSSQLFGATILTCRRSRCRHGP